MFAITGNSLENRILQTRWLLPENVFKKEHKSSINAVFIL